MAYISVFLVDWLLRISFEWHLVEFLELIETTVPFVEDFEEVSQFLCDLVETFHFELVCVHVL